jgi:hypothetical protein
VRKTIEKRRDVGKKKGKKKEMEKIKVIAWTQERVGKKIGDSTSIMERRTWDDMSVVEKKKMWDCISTVEKRT